MSHLSGERRSENLNKRADRVLTVLRMGRKGEHWSAGIGNEAGRGALERWADGESWGRNPLLDIQQEPALYLRGDR